MSECEERNLLRWALDGDPISMGAIRESLEEWSDDGLDKLQNALDELAGLCAEVNMARDPA